MYKQEDGKEMEGNGVWSPQNAQKWRASTEETSARGPEDTMNGGVDRNPKSEYDQTEHTSTNAKHDTHVPRSEKDGAEREEVVLTRHRLTLSGDSWPDILKENHAAFDEAFDIDICGALGLPRGSVKDAKLGSDGQTVSFGVRHPTSLLKSDVKRALGQCSFENAWRLYGSPRTGITPDAAYPPLRASEEAQPPLYDMEVSTPSVAGGCGSFPLKIVRPRLIEHGKCSISANTPSVEVLRGALYDENTVVTRHRVKFNGSSWGSILKHRLEELDKALDADVCETVGLPPGSVEGAKYVPDGLTVSFGVRHSASLHRKSVAELLAKGQFVNIWSLYARYKREGATNGVPHGSSGATGSIQPTVCSPKNASSHTPSTHHKMVEAVEVPHDVHARPSQPQHQGVLEETTVPLETKEKRADVAGGVSVDTFHTTPVGETSVVTRHRVKLNGDDWPDVFNNQRVAFDDAFDCDVCTSVKLPRGSVQDVTLGPDGQSVAFGVQHPSSLLRSDVKKALRTCPFTRTLALYNSRPIGDYINPTVSALAAPNVLAPQPIGQYADACSLPPERANQSHVRTMVSCDLVDGGLFTRSSPFIEVYNGACVEEDIVVTHHGVMLNGANWMSVFMKGVPFDDAFDADVCGAVGLPRGCVENIKMGPDGHLVTFSVRHPASVRGSDIKKALRKSPFVNTLRLYQSGSVASSNINTPPTLRTSEEAPIQLRQKESAPYTLSSELGNPSNTKTLLPFENTNETTNTSAVSVPTFNAVPRTRHVLVIMVLG
ncbi:unnamed protein product [Trypanosoma congolense IL3000]|uniref:WGS project CAEQ00000000 data, annotated contig 1002 n=1 Tax=Trypanosoma congolense (strain IL3000) TaxID=1068625 RepID=F9W356_TRYCI|nr:unnamed protein product [Trypanosoma congolense IL3000]